MDLNKRASFILDSEVSAYAQNGRIRGGLGSFNVSLQSVPNLGWTHVGSVTKYLFDDVDKDFINSENATLLLKLYASLNATQQNKLEKILIEQIDKDAPYKDASYLIGFFFVRLGKLTQVTERAFTSLKGDTNHAYSNFLHMLKLVIAREYSYFHFDELSDLSDLLKDDEEAKHALLATLREACKQLMSQSLDNQENPEVIKDLKNIVTFFNANFPDEDIPNQIKHIEDLFKQGQFSPQSYATCVDRVRVLIVAIARFLAIEHGIKNPSQKDDKVFGKYLYDNKVITEQEHDLLVAFYSLCSNSGSHISKSDRNTARLIKNMGFEITALLVTYLK